MKARIGATSFFHAGTAKTIHLRFWLQFQPLSFGIYGENKSKLLKIF
jgi:hypothetical protein